jgi:hypothetical protein
MKTHFLNDVCAVRMRTYFLRDLTVPVIVAIMRTDSTFSHFAVLWSTSKSHGPASLLPASCSSWTCARVLGSDTSQHTFYRSKFLILVICDGKSNTEFMSVAIKSMACLNYMNLPSLYPSGNTVTMLTRQIHTPKRKLYAILIYDWRACKLVKCTEERHFNVTDNSINQRRV